MNLYHFIDKQTKLVVYADKPDAEALEEVSAANPGFTVVPSSTGQPNAPHIFPGFLYYEDTFWSPQRMASQVTSGNITLDKDDFLRLLTFDEMVALYNFQADETLPVAAKRLINAFLQYMGAVNKISLSHPTVLNALRYFEEVGYLSAQRKTEILAVTYKQ